MSKRFHVCLSAAALVVTGFLVAGCGGGGSSSGGGGVIAPPAGVTVGPAGGTFTAAGVEVQVPPGALAQSVTITVSSSTDVATGEYFPAGPPWRLGPAGTRFASPVSLTFPYDPTSIQPPRTTSELVVLKRDDGTGVVTPLSASALDTVRNRIRVQVSSFSTFQPALRALPDPGRSRVSATPVSVRANGSDTATVTVTVLDAAGRPIPNQAVTLSASGAGNRLTQPGPTDANGVATGALASSVIENKTISAAVGQITLIQTASVAFGNPPPPLPPPPASSTRIETLVGSGTQGSLGDGGPASTAQLDQPDALNVDAQGNLAFVDAGNARVRRVDLATGTITTVAGDGTTGFSGDGGPAVAAQLNGVQDLAFDALGNLYLADAGNARIRRVDARTGIITTVAGGGVGGNDVLAVDAQLAAPSGIDVGLQGDLLIADGGSVRRVEAQTGIIRAVATLAQVGGLEVEPSGHTLAITPATGRVWRLTAPSQTAAFLNAVLLAGPHDAIPDGLGGVLVTERDAHTIRHIDAGGATRVVAGIGTAGFSGDGGLAAGSVLNLPSGAAREPAGTLVFSDRGNHRLRRLSELSPLAIPTQPLAAAHPDSRYRETLRASGGSGSGYTWAVTAGSLPPGITLSSGAGAGLSGIPSASGSYPFTLQVQDDRGHTANRGFTLQVAAPSITTVIGDGTIGDAGDGGPAAAATVYRPFSVAVASDGDLIFVDHAAGRLRRIDAATGIVNAIPNAQFSAARAVRLDAADNMFVSDMSTARVYRLDARTGVRTTVAGSGAGGSGGDGGPATNAGLSANFDIAVDRDGTLYLCSAGNHRVRRVEAITGIITTIAGNGVEAFAGDGGPATSASLDTPTAIVLDLNGDVLVFDNGNARIRRISATTGIITTIAGNGTLGWSGDGGPAASAMLDYIYGMLIDPARNLIVVEGGSSGSRVRKIDLESGIITTIAGGGTTGFAGDGGVAAAAELNAPRDVARDPFTGALYVADANNRRIRVLQVP